MKLNPWTRGLLAVGIISLPAVTPADEPEKPTFVETALTQTTLSGYIDTAMIWKFGTGNANMPGRVYDGADVQDGFNLSVVSLTLEKPLDEGQWSAGYRVQMLLGPGARKRGTGTITGDGEIAFNEAVVLLRAPVGNGIDLKVGQFGTYNGYEAYDTYKNPNWSRSYGFYIESSAHTGVSATYQVTEGVTLMAGVGNTASFSNGVDARSTTESKKAYLGMITLTAPESWGFLKGASLSAGYTGGVNNGVGEPWVENWYVGASIPTPLDWLTVGLAWDYTDNIPTATNPAGERGARAYAAAAYLVAQATEKLKIAGRLDYGHGSNEAFGFTSSSDDPRNELISYTATLDYSLWKNVISRVEFRWDHCLSSDTPFGGSTAGTGTDKNAMSVNLNVIYQF
ncbi:MAG TPA: outer membrane beta-barrel protein [Methylomirabilota bacterium]|nr:outer membrane beta-barrel protein [Methylomirabilota bacterium]